MSQTLTITRLTDSAIAPARAHAGDAGFDLCADEAVVIAPGTHALIRTGIAMAFADGVVGMVCPRSGLAAKNGVTVLNAPGIVDSGYRGEVRVNLVNHSETHFSVQPGDRIAQLVFVPFVAPDIEHVDSIAELGRSDRGEAGYGSTGVGQALPVPAHAGGDEARDHRGVVYPHVTRVAVITDADGLVYENYRAYSSGVEVAIQDGGRTVKLLPA